MISIIDSGNDSDWGEYEKVVPEIAAFHVGKKPPVHSVMAYYEQSIVTIANYRDGNKHRPPAGMTCHQAHGAYNQCPTQHDVC
jgi:hypothetical protein